jgi:hypothetical protein
VSTLAYFVGYATGLLYLVPSLLSFLAVNQKPVAAHFLSSLWNGELWASLLPRLQSISSAFTYIGVVFLAFLFLILTHRYGIGSAVGFAIFCTGMFYSCVTVSIVRLFLALFLSQCLIRLLLLTWHISLATHLASSFLCFAIGCWVAWTDPRVTGREISPTSVIPDLFASFLPM